MSINENLRIFRHLEKKILMINNCYLEKLSQIFVTVTIVLTSIDGKLK